MLRLAAGLLLGSWVGAAAQAESLARSPSDYLTRFDADGDGRVALSEYQNYMSRGFTQMDRDGNGQLSADELPRGARAPRAPTVDSHRRSLAVTFERQDANRDGYLDARELAAPPR